MAKLLTVQQFANELGVTTSCIRRWVHLRRLEVVHIGRLVRIPIEERDRIIKDGTVPALSRRGVEYAK
jgi:excisionase family DNA binding protein